MLNNFSIGYKNFQGFSCGHHSVTAFTYCFYLPSSRLAKYPAHLHFNWFNSPTHVYDFSLGSSPSKVFVQSRRYSVNQWDV